MSGPGPPPELVDRLRAAGCVFAEEEAALLVAAGDQCGGTGALETLVRRRVAGEPLETVLGWADFCGLRVVVEPGVFVPRRRTGLMVREAVRLLRTVNRPVAVDLCCGSGAVGAALLAAVPGLEAHAADVDPAAVHCARRNLPPGSVHAGDLYDALPASLRGRVHVLAANTPYVPTEAIATMPPEARDHEPGVALDGGPDGLDVARRVAAAAPEWLAPGGTLAVEASRRQAARLADVFSSCGLDPRVVREDDLDATLVLGTLAT